jgi:PPP family 3-phenylpropionic acid transporter
MISRLPMRPTSDPLLPRAVSDSSPLRDNQPVEGSALPPTVSSFADLHSMRLFYFLYFGGLAFVLPFLNLIFRRAGLTGAEIGWLATVSSGVSLLAAPMWGRWSDRLPDPRRLIQLGLFGAGASLIWLNYQQAFVWVAAAVGIGALFSAGIEPLANSLVLRITPRGEEGFGRVRAFGSLGWALIVLIGGWLYGAIGRSIAFFGAAAAYTVGALALGLMGSLRSQAATTSTRQGATRAAIRELGRDRAMVSLAACLTIVWITGIGRQQFEAIYLDQLGAGEWLIGIAFMIPAVIELPAMLWADRQVARWGPAAILGASLLLSGAAEALVLVHASVMSVMLLRAIGGVSFSLFTVSSVTLLGRRAPAQHKALVMTVYLVALYEACLVVAAPAVGWLFDVRGAYWLYLLALVGNLLGWAILRWPGRGLG